MEAPGLVVLPYHRILVRGPSLAEARRALGRRFRLTESRAPPRPRARPRSSKPPYAFGLAEPGGGALVAEALPEARALLPADAPPSLRALDTYFLHHAVLARC